MADIIIPELNGLSIDEFIKNLDIIHVYNNNPDNFRDSLEQFLTVPNARFLRYYCNGYDERYSEWNLDNLNRDEPYILENFEWFPETDKHYGSFDLSMHDSCVGFFSTAVLSTDFEYRFAENQNVLYQCTIKKSWEYRLQKGFPGGEELLIRI